MTRGVGGAAGVAGAGAWTGIGAGGGVGSGGGESWRRKVSVSDFDIYLTAERCGGVRTGGQSSRKARQHLSYFARSLQWAYELVRQSRQHRDNKHQERKKKKKKNRDHRK